MNFGRILEMRDATVIKFVDKMDRVGREPHTALYYLKQLYLADKRGRKNVYDFPDLWKIEKRIEKVREVIEDVSGDEVVEKHPHLEGKQIYDQLVEMRVYELRHRE